MIMYMINSLEFTFLKIEKGWLKAEIFQKIVVISWKKLVPHCPLHGLFKLDMFSRHPQQTDSNKRVSQKHFHRDSVVSRDISKPSEQNICQIKDRTDDLDYSKCHSGLIGRNCLWNDGHANWNKYPVGNRCSNNGGECAPR